MALTPEPYLFLSSFLDSRSVFLSSVTRVGEATNSHIPSIVKYIPPKKIMQNSHIQEVILLGSFPLVVFSHFTKKLS